MFSAADRKERLASLAGVAVLHLLLGWALLLGFAPAMVQGVGDSLQVFNIPPPPPPPPLNEPEPVRKAERAPAPAREAGKAAPPRPRAEPPPVAAAPKIVRQVRPQVPAAIVPAQGGADRGLPSERPGTGTGAGGAGQGAGSGGSGTGGGGGGGGTGGSGSGGSFERAQLRGGRITARDYPRAANPHQGEVATRLTVSETGQVTGCRVVSSSGNAVLDATTCQLIRERFRFAPARDPQGNAVASVTSWRQRWWRD
jgi:protein TonB